MRSKLPIIAISWYYAATFGLIRHAKRRLPSPPGEGKRLARSAYRIRRIGACRRRYTQNRKCVPPLIRSGLSRTTFPQGKAFLRRVGTLLQHPTVHPLRPLRCHLPLHAGRQRLAKGAVDFFSRIKKTAPFFPERCCFHNIFSYFAGEVDRRVTSWYPPSTMEVEDTRVSLASRCRSGIFVTPQLHMVLLTLYRLASTLSCREPA